MITKMSASSMNAKTWYRSMLAGNEAFIPVYPAYDLISTTSVSSPSTAVTFDVAGLGSTYKHLQIRTTNKTDYGSADWSMFALRFNSDTTSSYRAHYLRGNGSSVSSAEFNLDTRMALGYGASTFNTSGEFGAGVIDILDFASTSKNTTVRSQTGVYTPSTKWVSLFSGVWLNTATVTSVTLVPLLGSNFTSGSRFSIYGIKG